MKANPKESKTQEEGTVLLCSPIGKEALQRTQDSLWHRSHDRRQLITERDSISCGEDKERRTGLCYGRPSFPAAEQTHCLMLQTANWPQPIKLFLHKLRPHRQGFKDFRIDPTSGLQQPWDSNSL